MVLNLPAGRAGRKAAPARGTMPAHVLLEGPLALGAGGRVRHRPGGFLVTASGVSLFGVGSAFWGLVAGGLATLALHRP